MTPTPEITHEHPLHFEVVAGDPQGARVGRMTTGHGVVDTPAFMPVGTRGAVKGVAPDQLRSLGAQIMLANAYHLADRPGPEIIRQVGGLHRFASWSGPILTDSGGFQVLSLAELRKIDEEGVEFRSPVDGRALKLTPENILDIQGTLGSDIAMILDHCPPANIDRSSAEEALERTMKWIRRAARYRQELRTPEPMAVFGIQQGGAFEDLRQQAGRELAELPFDGFAVGGVSVGEDRDVLFETIPWGARALPPEKPRYLMGVGGLPEFTHAVSAGIDLFDCVIPTRNARNGNLFLRGGGVLRIKNSSHKTDTRPIEEGCDCPTCQNYSRAFLHHLVLRREFLGYTLTSLHNLRVFLRYLEEVREAIRESRWAEFVAEEKRRWRLAEDGGAGGGSDRR